MACSRCRSRRCGLDGVTSWSDLEPRFCSARGVSRSLRESEANSPVRNRFRSPYFKRRARHWRADWFRVNALASRPGRSRFAACVRAFATSGCVCGGLSGWASAAAWPSAWPTLAEVSPGCLSAHRETFPRSGVSGERSRRVYVSRVITAVSGAVARHVLAGAAGDGHGTPRGTLEAIARAIAAQGRPDERRAGARLSTLPRQGAAA